MCDEELNVKKIIATITYLHKEGLKKIFPAAVKLHLLVELYIFLHVLLACMPNIAFNAVFWGAVLCQKHSDLVN